MINFLRFRPNSSHNSIQVIDFLKYRWFSAALSAIIIITFVGTYFYKLVTQHQTFNYSVDFTGGIETRLSFSSSVSGEQIEHILRDNGWPGAITRKFSPTEYSIRVKKEAKDVQSEAEKIRDTLKNNLSENYQINIEQTDSVGSATGSTLRTKSLYAVIASMILMLLYIALRFWSFSYAMGAVVSLFHDAIVILAIFLLFDKEISINVIGAILAVLGYSINDTIVIFARIRDNARQMPNASMYDIINISVTETLSRTILTTFATTLVVIALFLFGGETLSDLSLALLIGIIFGIYSTIFIATPVLYMFSQKKRSQNLSTTAKGREPHILATNK